MQNDVDLASEIAIWDSNFSQGDAVNEVVDDICVRSQATRTGDRDLFFATEEELTEGNGGLRSSSCSFQTGNDVIASRTPTDVSSSSSSSYFRQLDELVLYVECLSIIAEEEDGEFDDDEYDDEKMQTATDTDADEGCYDISQSAAGFVVCLVTCPPHPYHSTIHSTDLISNPRGIQYKNENIQLINKLKYSKRLIVLIVFKSAMATK